MGNPNITLIIEQGPKQGEALDFSPEKVIRIGRILRGNTIAIKNPEISQKHIIVEFHQDVFRWMVTDLETANGTTVNESVISSNVPFPLSDGDSIKIGAKTLISVRISAPILDPKPRTRRGQRVGADAAASGTQEVKVAELEKHVGNESSQVVVRPKSAVADEAKEDKKRRPKRGFAGGCSAKSSKEQHDVAVVEKFDELNQNHQICGAQLKRHIVSTRASKNKKSLESVIGEGECRTNERFSENLKEKNVESMVGQQKVEEPTKNGGKRRNRTKCIVEPPRVLSNDAPLVSVAMEQKVEGALKGLSVADSGSVMIMKEDNMEVLKNTGGLVKKGSKGRARAKAGGGSISALCKEALEPVVRPAREGRVTRASSMTINRTALVGKEHNKEEERIKKEKDVETGKIRGKHRERGKGGNPFSKISRKTDALEVVEIEDKAVTSSDREVSKDIPKNKRTVKINLDSIRKSKRPKRQLNEHDKVNSLVNSIGIGKNLAVSREVSFMVEERVTQASTMMSEPNEKKLVYSWSSFSEIRGIPNTTSKYREDRLINCHATPFEARVERALKRGFAETSSALACATSTALAWTSMYCSTPAAPVLRCSTPSSSLIQSSF